MIFERGYFEAKSVSQEVLNLSLQESRRFTESKNYSRARTVFISHKHSDLSELRGVMGLFKECNANIYIDSMDNKMPSETSGDTAHRIKEVIKFCKKFVLMATEKAIESYWCNWELGFGDSHKYIENIAILPIKEKGTYDHNYKGNEYLQIYPRINYNTAFTNRNGVYFEAGYYVEKPKNKDGLVYIEKLCDWLKS